MIIFVMRKLPMNLIFSGCGTEETQFLENNAMCLLKRFGSTEGVAMGMVGFTVHEGWFHLASHLPVWLWTQAFLWDVDAVTHRAVCPSLYINPWL